MGMVMNPIHSYISQVNVQKEIKSSFMPKIKREPKHKNFNNKLSSNLTKYLYNFLTYKESYEMGKINLFFMNNIIEYFEETEPWPEKIRTLKGKYKFKIFQNEVDETLKESKIKKRRYKFPSENEKEVNYYQYDIDGNQYISIARTFYWAHKNTDNYWREEKIEGSYEKDANVPYLITVCWMDTNFSFFHVKPNNYKLYINETFIRNKRFIEKIFLKVIIDENIIIYNQKFPNQSIFGNNNNDRNNARLNEDFICYIKKEDFENAKKDENGDCKIRIEFNQVNLFWKGGWFIDGGSLKEITQKEMDNEIEIMNKNMEEEERKKYFGKNNDKNEDEKEEEIKKYFGKNNDEDKDEDKDEDEDEDEE